MPKKKDDIIGRKITNFRKMTLKEMEREGWEHFEHAHITVLDLDDGSSLYASKDEEGNGPGELMCRRGTKSYLFIV